MKSKGQAAMEFLMTYGWAILAAIVAIGVLAYFGVFSPGKITGNSIVVNNPFYASGTQVIVTTSEINLEMVNNGGDPLIISSLVINGTGENIAVGCMNDTISILFHPGVTNVVNIPCNGTLTSGNNFAGEITINYNKVGSQLGQTINGQMSAVIQ
ncbi:MAG: hypothetical protein ACP5NS_03640 [Candidatus Pacearchaeota archaeon]